MPFMEFLTDRAEERYDEFIAAAPNVMIGLDFDGTLAPIVADPEKATIHPQAPGVLLELAKSFQVISVITGRPVDQVLRLGGLEAIGQQITAIGGELRVFGHYGAQQWSSTDKEIRSSAPPAGLAGFIAELPRLLAEARTPDAWVEDKGLAVAVHTRRCADPEESYARLLPVLANAASAHGLDVEPGRRVVEIRLAEMDKGLVVHALAEQDGVHGFCFIGDDLGDLAAFEAVRALREQGLATLLVTSESGEESALMALADVAVPGPSGVVEFLAKVSVEALRADF